jgi:hypothetical protein
MRTNRIFWAVVLIAAGFIFLLNNLGLFDTNLWNYFWPTLLVVLGIWFLVSSRSQTDGFAMEEGSVDLGDAESASIVVKYGAGRMMLDASADEGKLVSGTFANGLNAQVKKVDSGLDVVLQPNTRDFPEMFFPGNWIGGRGLSWDFGLSKEIPLKLVFETGGAETHLDLTDLQVKDLVLKTGASSTEIKLPSKAGTTSVKLEAGAASVAIRIPEGVAARVEAEAGLASISVDQERFPKQGGIYQSEDFETAPNKVDIRIETGLASIEIS